MVNFLFSNIADVVRFWKAWDLDLLDAELLAGPVFQMMIAIFFLVDTLYFTFGYLVDSKSFGTHVRSVEPTLLGWAVALICYPPFNALMGRMGVGWYSDDNHHFAQSEVDLAIRALLVVLFAIYLAATLALGTRCSNLTNRGVVSRGPYAVIRHPAYATKVLGWWLFMLPVASVAAVASVSLWTVVYYLRAITEEQHLSLDAEYQAYRVAVKHRFIPGLW
jgi:protein-S-isoprenylcysteine O-methyltransferase Ste14